MNELNERVSEQRAEINCFTEERREGVMLGPKKIFPPPGQ